MCFGFSNISNQIAPIYCDPGASWQKGAIEKNYEYIRYILPKGRSFDKLTEDNVNKIKSHINSVSRDSLEGKTPYDVIEPIISKEILLIIILMNII